MLRKLVVLLVICAVLGVVAGIYLATGRRPSSTASPMSSVTPTVTSTDPAPASSQSSAAGEEGDEEGLPAAASVVGGFASTSDPEQYATSVITFVSGGSYVERPNVKRDYEAPILAQWATDAPIDLEPYKEYFSSIGVPTQSSWDEAVEEGVTINLRIDRLANVTKAQFIKLNGDSGDLLTLLDTTKGFFTYDVTYTGQAVVGDASDDPYQRHMGITVYCPPAPRSGNCGIAYLPIAGYAG